MRPAMLGEAYRLRGEVVRMARQVAYAEAHGHGRRGPAGQPVDRNLPAQAVGRRAGRRPRPGLNPPPRSTSRRAPWALAPPPPKSGLRAAERVRAVVHGRCRSRRRGLPGLRWGGPGPGSPTASVAHPGSPAADAVSSRWRRWPSTGSATGCTAGSAATRTPRWPRPGRPAPPTSPTWSAGGWRPTRPGSPDASAPDGTWWPRCRPRAGRSARRPMPWSPGCRPWPPATGRCWCVDRSPPAICGPPAAGSRWRPAVDRESLRDRRVLVFDDSITTGARAQSAGAALRMAGADVIGVVAVGRVVGGGRWAARRMLG